MYFEFWHYSKSAAASVAIPCSTFHYLRVECLLVCPRRARRLPFLRRRPQSSQSFSSPLANRGSCDSNTMTSTLINSTNLPWIGRVRLVLVLERDSEYATLARVE